MYCTTKWRIRNKLFCRLTFQARLTKNNLNFRKRISQRKPTIIIIDQSALIIISNTLTIINPNSYLSCDKKINKLDFPTHMSATKRIFDSSKVHSTRSLHQNLVFPFSEHSRSSLSRRTYVWTHWTSKSFDPEDFFHHNRIAPSSARIQNRTSGSTIRLRNRFEFFTAFDWVFHRLFMNGRRRFKGPIFWKFYDECVFVPRLVRSILNSIRSQNYIKTVAIF